jgi:fused signal recognition particle receptor
VSGPEPAPGPGRLDRLRQGLRRTREGLLGRLAGLARPGAPPADWQETLETALIQADLGPAASARVVEAVRAATRGAAPTWEAARAAARGALREMLAGGSGAPVAAVRAGVPGGPGPRIVLCVGVNGGGKTTTAGKLARRLVRDGRSVILCAADTFRAAASEQLRVWAERVGAGFVGHRPGADPGAVVFDAVAAARARGAGAVVIDTAGRLHTQDPLMRELEKIVRVVGRQVEGAPHDVFLVLDATTGQNGVNQARRFLAAARVTGVVLTKLDGTAKGGVAVRIVQELGIPLRYVGTGEGPDDLVEFDPDEFLESLLPTAA